MIQQFCVNSWNLVSFVAVSVLLVCQKHEKINLLRHFRKSVQEPVLLKFYWFFLYGCETCFLTLKEEHRLRVFENLVLRRTFGCKRKWQKAGEDCIMRRVITCMLH
jgi:hypothetical protein